MPGKKWCRGKGRISQKRYLKFIPVSTNKFLVHWLIVFYLGQSHSPVNGPALAQCGMCSLAQLQNESLSKQNFEHVIPQIQGHLGSIIIYSSALLFRLTSSDLRMFRYHIIFMSHHNLNNYVTGDSLSLFHFLLSQYFLMFSHHQTSNNSTCQYFICPLLCALN